MYDDASGITLILIFRVRTSKSESSCFQRSLLQFELDTKCYYQRRHVQMKSYTSRQKKSYLYYVN